MFRLLIYLLFFPLWLIWWFIKIVFYFMLQLEVFLGSFYASGAIRRGL